mgnify:FL=1
MTAESTLEFDEAGVARIGGPLTFDTCAQLYGAMEKKKPEGAALATIDLGGVTRIDSAGLALLLEWQARHASAGARLSMKNAPQGLVKLAKLNNAVDLLGLSGRNGA